MVLTEEQKKEYKRKGEEYQKLNYNINEQMVRLEVQKSKLEKELKDSMPKIPNGIGFCYNCNVQSMIPSGYRNYPGTRNRNVSEPIYKCEICGYVEVKPVLMVPVLVNS